MNPTTYQYVDDLLQAMRAGEITTTEAADYARSHKMGYAVEYMEAADWEMLGALRRAYRASAIAQPAPVSRPMVTADCGHSVSRNLLMNASTGTACPDCYDRMSE